jgi:hypothetical protein
MVVSPVTAMISYATRRDSKHCDDGVRRRDQRRSRLCADLSPVLGRLNLFDERAELIDGLGVLPRSNR